mmetsp:Transcript_19412/g.45535  ORF Transcript_19412/g.45535 Transcript_19412/m.45535 type:complete len:297 (+) Transcript_19412:50-940(+)
MPNVKRAFCRFKRPSFRPLFCGTLGHLLTAALPRSNPRHFMLFSVLPGEPKVVMFWTRFVNDLFRWRREGNLLPVLVHSRLEFFMHGLASHRTVAVELHVLLQALDLGPTDSADFLAAHHFPFTETLESTPGRLGILSRQEVDKSIAHTTIPAEVSNEVAKIVAACQSNAFKQAFSFPAIIVAWQVAEHHRGQRATRNLCGARTAKLVVLYARSAPPASPPAPALARPLWGLRSLLRTPSIARFQTHGNADQQDHISAGRQRWQQRRKLTRWQGAPASSPQARPLRSTNTLANALF